MKKLFTLYLLVTIGACATPDEPLVKPETAPESVHKVALEDALEIAETFFAELEETVTRSSQRQVKSIEAITADFTRSASSMGIDTLFYVVNYGENDGFAVLAADERLFPVYAISTDTNIDLSLAEYDSGVNTILESLKLTACATISEFNEEATRSVTYNWVPLRNKEFSKGWKIKEKIGPSGNFRQFGQDYPLNTQLSKINGQYPVTGCTPLALFLVLADWEYPDHLWNYPVDWQMINRFPGNLGADANAIKKHAAEVVAILGSPLYLYTNYGLEESSTFVTFIGHSLSSLGFKYQTKQLIVDEFREYITKTKKPVLVSSNNTLSRGMNGGHTFVADGYMNIRTNYALLGDQHFIHYNFGWESKCNGWYKGYSLDLTREAHFFENENDQNEAEGPNTTNTKYESLTIYYLERK